MGIFEIDPAVKEKLLNERITQFNLEGYQHELNLKTAEAVGNADAVAEANDAIVKIQKAIEIAKNELVA